MSEENHELDPDIADLLGISDDEPEESASIELSDSSEYYQSVIEGVPPEPVDVLQKNKDAFLNATDKEEKGMYREKFAAAYWNFYRALSSFVMNDLSLEKKLSIRYGLLDPDLITEEQLKLIQSIPLDSENDEVYYVDEWLLKVGDGSIDRSVIDETLALKKSKGADQAEKLERKKGQKDAEIQVIKAKGQNIREIEKKINDLFSLLIHTEKKIDFEDNEEVLVEPYEETQRDMVTELLDQVKALSKQDRELKSAFRSLYNLDEDIDKLAETAESGADLNENDNVEFEMNTVKQMIKLCVGRQGNHFPVLLEPYFSPELKNIGTKDNVLKMIKEIERLDSELFIRTYKGEDHRIIPYIVLVPSYGEFGVCWDPIPKNNRATGKGRVIVPVFPKNLKVAMLAAFADLRWQVAKEKAHQYWMEEGLTGEYYEYYTKEKLKGDIKKHFIHDYMLWIVWESQGVQKIHKDVRNIFWRKMPFPQDIKDELKNKGFYYNELYEKDKRRQKSTGY